MSGKLIIISGPAGVGKSTTAQYLSKTLEKSAYIEGDVISHMSIAGRELPWVSAQANKLVWKNIKALTRNFLEDDCDVVVEWIIFLDDIKQYMAEFIKLGIEIRYAILWADKKIHLKRDQNRPIEVQMGERVLILRNEFNNSEAPSRYYLDNTNLSVQEVVNQIKLDTRFIVSCVD